MPQKFITTLLPALRKHRFRSIAIIQSFQIVQTAPGFDVRYGFNVKNEDVQRVRSQESGVRSQESGVRSQESGVRSQEKCMFIYNHDNNFLLISDFCILNTF